MTNALFWKNIGISEKLLLFFTLLIIFSVLFLGEPQRIAAVHAQVPSSTLTVNLLDESGFPPNSTTGTNKLADVPVNVYFPNDTFVTGGATDSNGTATFNLTEDTYKIVYGGSVTGPGGALGVASKIINVTDSPENVDLYCFYVEYHSFEGGGPFELNYISLNTSSSGYQDTIFVQPRQQVNAEFSWWELETQNVPVWYVSAFGNWSPTNTLGNLASGTASSSSHNLHTVRLTFAAPSTPGTYEVRLVGVLDYDWPNSFYTGAHYQPSLGRDTGISVIGKALDGPYGIGTIIVRENPTTHYNLTISTTEGGTTSPSPSVYTYDANALASVQANSADRLFGYWEIDGAYAGTKNPITILMDTNHILKAVFSNAPSTQALSLKISGECDYASTENITVKIVALVVDTDTMNLVSGANIALTITSHSTSQIWKSVNMTEIKPGIYAWQSDETIKEISSQSGQGIYTVIAEASLQDATKAYDILQFHIDSPSTSENSHELVILAGIIGLAVVLSATLLYFKKKPNR